MVLAYVPQIGNWLSRKTEYSWVAGYPLSLFKPKRVQIGVFQFEAYANGLTSYGG